MDILGEEVMHQVGKLNQLNLNLIQSWSATNKTLTDEAITNSENLKNNEQKDSLKTPLNKKSNHPLVTSSDPLEPTQELFNAVVSSSSSHIKPTFKHTSHHSKSGYHRGMNIQLRPSSKNDKSAIRGQSRIIMQTS